MTPPPPRCLTPGCPRRVKARGWCLTCYVKARRRALVAGAWTTRPPRAFRLPDAGGQHRYAITKGSVVRIKDDGLIGRVTLVTPEVVSLVIRAGPIWGHLTITKAGAAARLEAL